MVVVIMKYLSNAVLILILIALLLVGLIHHQITKKDNSEEAFENDLKIFLSKHESELINYRTDIVEKRIQLIKGLVGFPPPNITDDKLQFEMVTIDANGNAYFILKESNVFYDVGLVCQPTVKPILGDGCAERITYLREIEMNWFVFTAK